MLEVPPKTPLPENALRFEQLTRVAPNPLVRNELQAQLRLDRPSLRGL